MAAAAYGRNLKRTRRGAAAVKHPAYLYPGAIITGIFFYLGYAPAQALECVAGIGSRRYKIAPDWISSNSPSPTMVLTGSI